MKNLIIVLLLFVLGCSNSNDNNSSQNQDTIVLENLPEIGNKLHDSIIQTSNSRAKLVTSGQFWPSTTVKINGNIFDIAWNNDGIVKYISTNDKNFITPENIRVNMTLNQISDIKLIDIQEMTGWGYYYELNSGWSVGLCTVTNNGCTGRELLETDTIKWFFKRGLQKNVADTSLTFE